MKRTLWLRRAAALIASGAVCFSAPRHAAAACESERPSDPGGYASEDFAGFDPQTYDTPEGNFRIHYVETGPSAPDLTTSGGNTAPDFIVLAGEVAEEALEGYESRGFRPVVRDDGPGACASNGGDGRIDIYFIDFGAGDGQTLSDSCQSAGGVSTCAGFFLVDAQLAGYPSDEIGMRTIVPHELFHLVQQAHVAETPPWFAEATAQWAADQLEPSLTDLELFVPEYFEEAHRSIDNPPGGAAAGFLYGTAIWPVFLGEQFGADVVRDVFERMGQGDDVFVATDTVLSQGDTPLSDAFPIFASFNVGTGDRAGPGGYTDAAAFPTLGVASVTAAPGEIVNDIMSGFSIRAYALPALGGTFHVTLDADEARVGAIVVPLSGGAAQLEQRAWLPAETQGDAIIVVAGRTPQKTDAPFSLTLVEGPLVGEGGGGPGGGGAGGDGDDGGCDCSTASFVTTSSPRSAAGSFAFALLAFAFVARFRARRVVG